jgi:hypothetical protein
MRSKTEHSLTQCLFTSSAYQVRPKTKVFWSHGYLEKKVTLKKQEKRRHKLIWQLFINQKLKHLYKRVFSFVETTKGIWHDVNGKFLFIAV